MDPPDPGIEPQSPALQADSSPTELSGKPSTQFYQVLKVPIDDFEGEEAEFKNNNELFKLIMPFKNQGSLPIIMDNWLVIRYLEVGTWGFPGGPVVKNLLYNAGDTGSIPGPGRSHMPWGSYAVCHD